MKEAFEWFRQVFQKKIQFSDVKEWETQACALFKDIYPENPQEPLLRLIRANVFKWKEESDYSAVDSSLRLSFFVILASASGFDEKFACYNSVKAYEPKRKFTIESFIKQMFCMCINLLNNFGDGNYV